MALIPSPLLLYLRFRPVSTSIKSEVIVKKLSKMPHQWRRVEFLEKGVSEDHQILRARRWATGVTQLAARYDVTSCLVDCKMQLNIAQKYIQQVQ